MKSFDLDPSPMNQLIKWYSDAEKAEIKNPDAMTLATASPSGRPSARIVLYKGTNAQGICFYTNYNSRKGLELIANPKACLVFYWSALDRQLRIEGRVKKLSAAESDRYWNTRPRESQLGALASNQSSRLVSRESLEKKITQLTKKYAGKEIPRPLHWGGFCLIPNRFEFWMAGDFRVHDRICYEKSKARWKVTRLSP